MTAFGVAWLGAVAGGGMLDHAGYHQLSKVLVGTIVATVGIGLVLNIGNASRWAGQAMVRQWRGTRLAPVSSTYAFGLWRMAGAFCILIGLALMALAVVAHSK